MKFDDAVSSILNESPFGDISQIRSTKFTEHPPVRSKFRKGDYAQLTGPAADKLGHGVRVVIVGMQRNTGPGHSPYVMGNRYYVRLPDDKIYPVSSQYLMPV